MKYLFALALSIACLTGMAQTHQAEIAAYRTKYINDFLVDKNSPLKKDDVQYLRFYDVDSTYKVEAIVEVLANVPTFLMATSAGIGAEYVPYAKLKFTLKGTPLVLTTYKSIQLLKMPGHKDHVFLPFTDDTNGKESYANGRYIDLTEGDIKNGRVTIDFNKAYNPYCAFATGYACPRPPEENSLAIAIEAGEKNYARGH